MTEHWHPRFGDRQMLVGNWALPGGPWWAALDAGPRSKLPRSGDLMDGDRRGGENAGGRVRRQRLARPQQQAGGQWGE